MSSLVYQVVGHFDKKIEEINSVTTQAVTYAQKSTEDVISHCSELIKAVKSLQVSCAGSEKLIKSLPVENRELKDRIIYIESQS